MVLVGKDSFLNKIFLGKLWRELTFVNSSFKKTQMKKKSIRTKGKLQLSKYFQELEKGDSVAVTRECAVQSSFPLRLQGQTGVVEGKRGKAYIIKLKDKNK